MELETYSHEGGKDILEEKGILSEIHELPQVWEKYGGPELLRRAQGSRLRGR